MLICQVNGLFTTKGTKNAKGLIKTTWSEEWDEQIRTSLFFVNLRALRGSFFFASEYHRFTSFCNRCPQW